MTTVTQPNLSTTLSVRLKTETASEHQRMHQLMAQAEVFSSAQRYAQFTLSQYYFQLEIEQLFEHVDLAAVIPDLDIRGRAAAALADLQDLAIQPQGRARAADQLSLPQALGWLYVSEGSTLGAAVLFKQAQQHLGYDQNFAARNLAAYPEGRATVWKRFVVALDQAALDLEEQNLVIAGALQAYAYFGQLLSELAQLD
jgi:heme oxygenase